MAADNDNFKVVNPLQHVESLTSVADRVTRKKDQQQKQDKKRKNKQSIDDQLEEEIGKDEKKNGRNGHVDFHA